MKIPRPRLLVISGLVITLLGTVDPLEGAPVILAGVVLLAFGAARSRSADRRLLYYALAFTIIGIAAMWGLTTVGGFGGGTGRSNWWGLMLAPYPVGWLLAVIGATRILRAA